MVWSTIGSLMPTYIVKVGKSNVEAVAINEDVAARLACAQVHPNHSYWHTVTVECQVGQVDSPGVMPHEWVKKVVEFSVEARIV